MYLFGWILVGTLIGWGTGKVLKGNGYGPVMDIGMGIVGAVTGGFLAGSSTSGARGTIFTTMVAALGAALLTVLAAYVNGRRLYARQL